MAEGEVIALIRDVYDNEMAEEIVEDQLERALYAHCRVIIIEPARLSDETARWIRIGNGLHKCAVVCGLSSICLCVSRNRHTYKFLVPLTLVSVFCAGLYMICWQFDPCCKYQIANAEEQLELIPKLSRGFYSDSINDYMNSPTSTALILLRKDDRTRKILHSMVAIFALTCTVIRFLK